MVHINLTPDSALNPRGYWLRNSISWQKFLEHRGSAASSLWIDAWADSLANLRKHSAGKPLPGAL